jgi:Ca-activated chloride channel family protein
LESVSTVLDGADVDAVDFGGTNFAEAIQTALKVFPDDEKEPSKRGRVILLYTDGEPTAGEGDLREALAEAKKRHVAVVTIGVGTPQGQPIPDGQSFWGEAEYKHDNHGRMVVSRLDEDTLRLMASSTGGIYVQGNSSKALSNVEGLLSKLDKTLMRGQDSMKRQELAPSMGLAASLCLLAAVVW